MGYQGFIVAAGVVFAGILLQLTTEINFPFVYPVNVLIELL